MGGRGEKGERSLGITNKRLITFWRYNNNVIK